MVAPNNDRCPAVRNHIDPRHGADYREIEKFLTPVKSRLPNFVGVRGRHFRSTPSSLGLSRAGGRFHAGPGRFRPGERGHELSHDIYTAKPPPEVTNGLGIWIWDRVTFDKQNGPVLEKL